MYTASYTVLSTSLTQTDATTSSLTVQIGNLSDPPAGAAPGTAKMRQIVLTFVIANPTDQDKAKWTFGAPATLSCDVPSQSTTSSASGS